MKMIQKIGRGRGLLGEVERVLILPPEDPFIYIYIYTHTHTHSYYVLFLCYAVYFYLFSFFFFFLATQYVES